MRGRLKELEDAVCDVIQIIKQIPELTGTKLAVVGGLALWHYLPDYRPTNNINFVTNATNDEDLSFLEQKLLEHPNSPFIQDQQALFYHSPAGWDIQIKISTRWHVSILRTIFFFPGAPEFSVFLPAPAPCSHDGQSPYLPEPTHFVYEIPYGQVPYISPADLVASKINSTQLKTSKRRQQDADDAKALIDHELAGQLASQRTAVFDENLRAYRRRVVESMALHSPQQEIIVKEVPYGVYPAMQMPTLGI
ncbi:hypothetical protein GQX73_g6465 [Xylaria multiplex]|uniref:Uncharacterized protein n=1 Tax=Xylaria multiplex TaxID=323545 RepID=A0A7C8MSU8_9PEZI|nr:hypothetical protein GQX73_g6465 [Xylaria multiplex]